MTLSRSEIVERLVDLLGPEAVVTDEQQLRASSLDRFRKYELVHGVYIQPIPAAIAMAASTEDVAAVLALADEHGINIVPRTGGSATEGGLETVVPDSVVLDGSRMDRILDLDLENLQATVQCGVPLQVLDDRLRELGWTTGHSPQSKPLAQLGGLVATRSIGQLSTLYGGIEDMVAGLEAVFPGGEVARIKSVPRRAAGPDIRHVVIGNEGALCFITEVTVKIFRYRPENHRFVGWTVPDMPRGFALLREVMTEGYRPSVARLYDETDGGMHFSHFADGRCVLLFMAEGSRRIAEATAAGITDVVESHGGEGCVAVDPALLATWFDDLNWGPDKVAAELEDIRRTSTIGYTLEVSACWSAIHDIYAAVCRRLPAEVPDLTMVGGHSSHSYVNGTNMYFVYEYVVRDCPVEEEISRYHQRVNAIICEETLDHGGSIVHHHGIGKARTPWVQDEYGSSYGMLRQLKTAFDPHGVMNAGTVLPLPPT